MRSPCSVLGLFALLCCACSGPIAGLPPGAVNQQARMEMLRWHNDLRGADGAAALAADPRLMQIAQQHAEFIAFKGRLQHEDGAGGFAADRAAAAGYTGSVAENLGYALSATEVFEDWQDSAPHLATMLDPGFSQAGVGRATSGIYEFWVVVFGEPR